MLELLAFLADQVDWPRRQAADPRDPRWLGEGPCGHRHRAEKKWRSNSYMIWSVCQTCALRLEAVPMKNAPAAHHQTALASTVTTALSLARERDLWSHMTGHMMRGLIKEVQGRNQATKAKARPTRRYVNTDNDDATTVPSPSWSRASSPAPSVRSEAPSFTEAAFWMSRWLDAWFALPLGQLPLSSQEPREEPM